MCRPNGSVFDKKSLNMGPIFGPKIPKHGSIFFFKFLKIFKKIACFWSKIPKHGSIFGAKSLKHGHIFYSKHGLGSRGPGGTPPSKPKLSTPPRGKREGKWESRKEEQWKGFRERWEEGKDLRKEVSSWKRRLKQLFIFIYSLFIQEYSINTSYWSPRKPWFTYTTSY